MSAVKETIVVLNGGEFIKKQWLVRLLGIACWIIIAQFIFPSTPEYIAEHTFYYWALTMGLGYAAYRATTGWYLFMIAQQKQINEQIRSYLGLNLEEAEDRLKMGELAVKLQLDKKVKISKPGASDAEFSIDTDKKGNKVLKIVN